MPRPPLFLSSAVSTKSLNLWPADLDLAQADTCQESGPLDFTWSRVDHMSCVLNFNRLDLIFFCPHHSTHYCPGWWSRLVCLLVCVLVCLFWRHFAWEIYDFGRAIIDGCCCLFICCSCSCAFLLHLLVIGSVTGWHTLVGIDGYLPTYLPT